MCLRTKNACVEKVVKVTWKITLQCSGSFLVGRDVSRKSCLWYVCAHAHITQWKLKRIISYKQGMI